VLAVISAFAVLGAGCGSGDRIQAQPEGESDGPVPIVLADGGAASMDDASDMASTMSAEGGASVWGDVDYELADGVVAPATEADGWRLEIDDPAGEVARIASVLGIEGDVTAVAAELGGGWRVGPEDGSAPMVAAVPNGDWWYQPEFADRPTVEDCAARPMTAGELGVSDEEFDDLVAEGEAPMFEECAEPEPPTGIIRAEAATQRATATLADLGLEGDDIELTETYADEWTASVSAVRVLEGAPTPLTFNFAYGEEGRLEWAGGHFGTPTAVGPYPLVDVPTAVERLRSGAMVGVGGPMALDGGATVGVAGAGEGSRSASDEAEAVPAVPATPAECGPDELCELSPEMIDPSECSLAADCGPDVEMFNPEPVEVSLVSVELGLLMAIDAEGTTWLLPSFEFTDAQGGTHSTYAVTDEFLVTQPGGVDLPAQPVPDGPGDAPSGPVDGGTGEQPLEGAPPLDDDPAPAVDDAPDASIEPSPPATIDPDQGVSSPPLSSAEPAEPGEIGDGAGELEEISQAEADALVGLSEDEARDVASARGWEVRLASVDGEPFALTEDYSPVRVNLTIVADEVTEVAAW